MIRTSSHSFTGTGHTSPASSPSSSHQCKDQSHHHHQGNHRRLIGTHAYNGVDNNNTLNSIHRGRGGEEAGEEDGDEVVAWNLRKCSAAGLDVLSTVFGDELLPIVLPIVQAHMQSSDWRARESATLALGAISEGCAQGLLPYLPVGDIGLVPLPGVCSSAACECVFRESSTHVQQCTHACAFLCPLFVPVPRVEP